MYPICSSPAGAQPTSQPQPPLLNAPPPRPRLSSFDIDRHLADRLRSLSPPAPVSVYLPAPRADELQQRFERLQAGGRYEREVDEAELERRLKRLQGEEVPASEDGKRALPAAASPPPHMPVPIHAHEGDELESLLRQVQDEVKLDYQDVYETAAQLGRPLDDSSNTHRQKGDERKHGVEGKTADGVDVDDAEQLMNELQRLPSTEIVKLKHAAGSTYHSDHEYDDSDDEG